MDEPKPLTPEELRRVQDNTDILMKLSSILKCKWQEIPASVKKIEEEIAQLKAEISQMKG